MRKQCKQCEKEFDAKDELIYFAVNNVKKKH
jgi:hypothetical protein